MNDLFFFLISVALSSFHISEEGIGVVNFFLGDQLKNDRARAMPGIAHAAQGGELKRKRRKSGHSKKSKKNVNVNHGGGPKVRNITPKMKKLFRKRAREYNSDNDDDESNVNREDDQDISMSDDEKKLSEDRDIDDNSADVSSDGSGEDDNSDSDDDHGIAKFKDGSKAFEAAFRSIMKKGVPDDGLVSFYIFAL